MTSLESFQVFKILFKERYKDPTLQLILPTMIVGYIFIPSFLIKGNFLSYALVLANIPIISIPETIAIALALRNVIFVLGDHMNSGSIVSFLMMPVKRRTFFFMSYFNDIVLPFLMWAVTYFWYLWEISLINDLTILMALVYASGYFFSTSVILLYTVLLRSNGAATLASMFTLGSIFIIGGIGNYELLISGAGFSSLSLTSFMNTYPLILAYSINPSTFFYSIQYVVTGIEVDSLLGLILLIISYLRFRVMEF
ncbi:hypothetical protein [Stygiolobus caldivivus]|uniref:Uncharacterized protein n=1 Tax=Stygiolobus caldivivus TaxID=2824673 RepID=A0A8D5ZEC0_9CREN|nr:hypothetical protein [Stygiolobus caldivivus]BCU69583.1 hypothetical protein KN1_08800 [Stygiolobus caldivivus]